MLPFSIGAIIGCCTLMWFAPHYYNMQVKRKNRIVSPVTIYVPAEIHERALKNGVNMSSAGRDGILRAVEIIENTGNPELSTARGRRATN